MSERKGKMPRLPVWWRPEGYLMLFVLGLVRCWVCFFLLLQDICRVDASLGQDFVKHVMIGVWVFNDGFFFCPSKEKTQPGEIWMDIIIFISPGTHAHTHKATIHS